MKRFLLFFLFLLVCVSMSQAQLSAVVFADSGVVYASGINGQIQKSSDSASTWVNQVSGTTNSLFGMAAVTRLSAWAVGGNPITGAVSILHTTNGGTWVAQTPATSKPLLAVSFGSSTVGVAVGYGGSIDITANGGTTWTSVVTGVLTTFNGVCMVNSSTGFLVGDLGVVMKTTNGGAAWTTQTSGTQNDLYAVRFTSTLAGLAVGSGGCILRTTNGGTTWTRATSGTVNNLNGITMTDSSHGYAVGNNITVLASTNGGTSWTAQIVAAVNYADVSFSPTASGVIVGDRDPKVQLTRNAGGTWSVPGGTGGGCTVPAVPTLVSPANGIANIDTSVFFTWSASTCATNYNLQVSTDNVFGVIVWNDTTASNSASNTIFATGTYYWRVRAFGDSGTSAFTPTWSFSTSNSTNAVFSVSPSSLAFGSVSVGASSTKYFRITNTGNGTMSITGVASSNPQFVPLSTTKTIAASATDSVGVRFSPTKKSGKTITAQITFTSNAANSPTILNVNGKSPR